MKRIINFVTHILIFVTFNIFSSLSLAESSEIPIGPDEVFIQNTESNEIKIMSYNLLNLFDTNKDLDKDDWLWLPRNYPGKHEACSKIPDERESKYCSEFDWNETKLNLKLNQIKKVVTFQGSLPDVMAVVEIENANVLKLLSKKLGYNNSLITESPDIRGIDVGLMYNSKSDFSFIKWESLPIQLKSGRPTRDILRADFKWKNSTLSIYVNHWPSQKNPTEERIAVARILKNNIDHMSRLYGDQWSAVAVGDFNTIRADQPNPIQEVIENSDWPNALFDAETYARNSIKNPALPYMPPGTFYFIKDDVWNEFDRIEVTQNLVNQKGIEFVQDSFRILFPEFMSLTKKRFENDFNQNFRDKNKSKTRRFTEEEPSKNFKFVRVPKTYNFDLSEEEDQGYSDHLPVVFKLRQ